MKITVSTSPKKSAKRIKALKKYYSKNILKSGEFICSEHRTCKRSHNGPFYKGQLNHVGEHYDISVAGVPFRTVIVGQESGGSRPGVTMTERYCKLMKSAYLCRFKSNQFYKARNPHMRGTTSVLRLIFGKKLGVDHASEYFNTKNHGPLHLFQCFALVNYLLCSALHKKGSNRGRPTRIMKENCHRHFRATLDVLQPTIVVVQGKNLRHWIMGAFDRTECINEEFYRGYLNGKTVFVATFTHPSTPGNGNWGLNEKTPYLKDTVVPVIKKIRAELRNRK